MKKGTENLLKFKKLAHRLEMDLWQVKGILQAIWDLTAESARLGDIGRHTNEEIAMGIGYRGDVEQLIGALVETGWLDRSGAHRLVVHDWHDHVEGWVKKRVERAGERFLSLDVSPDSPPPARKGVETPEKAVDLPENGGSRGVVLDNGGQRRTTADNGGQCPPRARAAHPSRAEPIQAERSLADPSRAGGGSVGRPAATGGRAGGAGGGREPPGSVGSAFSISSIFEQSNPEQYVRKRVARVMALTGEAAPYAVWWEKTIGAMLATDGAGVFEEALAYATDCGSEEARRRKDLGPLERPAAYIASRCKPWLHEHGRKLPPPPRGG